jgi:hypothetical protein
MQGMQVVVLALVGEEAELLVACMWTLSFLYCNSMYALSARYAHSILEAAAPEQLPRVYVLT